jgi:hypothetical protein
VEGCEAPRFPDPAVNAAVRELAGGEPDDPWTDAAWSSVVGKTAWSLTIDGASSLSGLECLGPPWALVLRGGRIEDFAVLGWESGVSLSLEAGLELGPAGVSGLADGYPERFELYDLALTAFPDISGLSQPLVVESHGTALTSLSGLANTAVVSLLIGDAPLTDVGALSTLGSLEEVDLSGTGVTQLPDLSGLSALARVTLDDTAVTALPSVGAPPSRCNGISALRTAIDEADVKPQADALCANDWVVEVSSGSGPTYECGTPLCR